MAQLNIAQKRVEDVNTTDNFTPIPEGEYSFQIENTEIVTGKTSGVPNLLLTLKVIEGNFKGKQVRHRLNLWSANATAVDISEGELGQLCKCFGMPHFPDDSAELERKPFNADVKIKQDEGYDPSNEIKTKSFRPYAQLAPGAPAPAAVPAGAVDPFKPQAATAPAPGAPTNAAAAPVAQPAPQVQQPTPAPAPAPGAAPDWTQNAPF